MPFLRAARNDHDLAVGSAAVIPFDDLGRVDALRRMAHT
jgi:hypothetical protein